MSAASSQAQRGFDGTTHSAREGKIVLHDIVPSPLERKRCNVEFKHALEFNGRKFQVIKNLPKTDNYASKL